MADEPEIVEARRAFDDAQVLLDRVPESLWPSLVDVSWYGTATHPERGAFAIVARNGPLADLVGDHLRVRYREKTVNVYVIASSLDVLTPLALTRRAYMALEVASVLSVSCAVEILT
jgi:hypothetical protein